MKFRKTTAMLLVLFAACLLVVAPFLTKYSIAQQEALLSKYANILPISEDTYYRTERIAVSRNKIADPFIKDSLENAKKNLNQGMENLEKAKSIVNEMKKKEKNIFSIKFPVAIYSINRGTAKVDQLIKAMNRQVLAVSEYSRGAIQDIAEKNSDNKKAVALCCGL